MRRGLVVVAVVVLVLVLFALPTLTHVAPLNIVGGGSRRVGAVRLSGVMWRGCAEGFCLYVLRNGSAVGVKDGRVVLELSPEQLSEALRTCCGNTRCFGGDRVGYEGGWLRVILSYTKGWVYYVPVNKSLLLRIVRVAELRHAMRSLNGTIHCLDGGTIARVLWDRMRDFNASDPAVKPYIDWLRNALAPEPRRALNVPWYPRYWYWWFNDRYGWKAPIPSNDSVVKIGLVKLPFGAGLIVTAYPSKDGVTIVVHGTIINESGWKELLARVGAFMGGLTNNPANITVQWVLWRIALDSSRWAVLSTHRSYLDTGSAVLPIKHVIVLLEMPAYTVGKRYWMEAEQAYWDVVGEPALALAVRLTFSSDTSPLELYRVVAKGLTIDVVLTGVHHPGDIPEGSYGTPFLIRRSGKGVCNEQSRSTSMFASNALAGYSAYIGLGVYFHALSAMLYTGGPIDVDKDGEPESEVIIDTMILPPSVINQQIRTGGAGVWYEPPLLYADANQHGFIDEGAYCMKCMYLYMRNYFYSGVAYAVLDLPDWLKAPWLSYTMDKSNFTGIERMAWANMTAYSVGFKRLPAMRRAVEKSMSNPLYVEPPSVALALHEVLRNLPVVYTAKTPGLKPVVFVRGVVEVSGNGTYFRGAGIVGGDNVTVTIRYGFNEWSIANYNITAYVNGERAWRGHEQGFLPRWFHAYFYYRGKAYNLTIVVKGKIGGGTPTETPPLPPAQVAAVINASWNGHAYKGNATVNGTAITVIVWRGSTGGWAVDVWVGGDDAYVGPATIENHAVTVWFAWEGTAYRVTAHLIGGPLGRHGHGSVTAGVRLAPVYWGVPTPWGRVPVVRVLRGVSIAGGANITVTAYPNLGRNLSEYRLTVYVNGAPAHSATVSLPATIEFRHDGVEYRVSVAPPTPPALNKAVEAKLVLAGTAPVRMPNGTVINVTVYRVNQTVMVGNATVVLFGYVTRLWTELDIYVFGVPPAKYGASIEGINATTSIDYRGALHLHIHYRAPQGQLIPAGTTVKTTIQPLNLTVTFTVRR